MGSYKARAALLLLAAVGAVVSQSDVVPKDRCGLFVMSNEGHICSWS